MFQADPLYQPVPEEPPGFAGFHTVMNWGFSIALMLCILALVWHAVSWAIKMRQGESLGDALHMTRPLIATVIISGSVALISGLASLATN